MNTFNTAATLSLNGVRLEPMTLAHEAGLREAAADGELWKIRVTSVPEPEKTGEYIETALKMHDREPFVVIDIATGKVIGSTSYHDIVPNIKRVEIGYTWYAKSVQRTHVNTTCKLMLMTHAFETLQCPVVGWRTDIFNFASQRAIERLGAKKDGVIRYHALRRDGTVRDTVIYSMLVTEWPEVKLMLSRKNSSWLPIPKQMSNHDYWIKLCFDHIRNYAISFGFLAGALVANLRLPQGFGTTYLCISAAIIALGLATWNASHGIDHLKHANKSLKLHPWQKKLIASAFIIISPISFLITLVVGLQQITK